jgi:hypothetical protein
MSTIITGDEPYFPRDIHKLSTGITIREQFSAMAMQGMLANSIENDQGMEPFWHMHPANLAIEAVDRADALIAALNKPVQP